MAGHSAWKNIKHKKAKSDARRGKAWSKCARAIITAARNGGGDPASNLALRYAMDEARAVNMPKDTIQNAIKKGTGELGTEDYESAVYGGYGPGGVAVMLEILTNNRNRTAGDLRIIFEKQGGNMGASALSHMFHNKGQVLIPRDKADEERVMTVALDAGAQDVRAEGENWLVICEVPDLIHLREVLEKAGLPIAEAGLTMVPTMTVTITGEDARRVLALMEALEDHDDVQKVYANFEIPDEELAALQQGAS